MSSRNVRTVEIFEGIYVGVTELGDYMDLVDAALKYRPDGGELHVYKYLKVKYMTTDIVDTLLDGMYYVTHDALIKYVTVGLEYGIPYLRFDYSIIRKVVSKLYTSDMPWYVCPSLFLSIITTPDPTENIKREVNSLQQLLEPFYLAILKKIRGEEIEDLSNLPEELQPLNTLEGRFILSALSSKSIRLLPEDEKLILSSKEEEDFFKSTYIDLIQKKKKLFLEVSDPALLEKSIGDLHCIYIKLKGLRVSKVGK